ncbi:MAG: hypothetical protein JXB88_13165 [Spirochaetales bacterium]|nr:hypothetical protein [Spirochaetales bacterium]
MKRAWIGIALLSCAWIFGVTFYHKPVSILFYLFITAGTFFFSGIPLKLPGRIPCLCASLLLVPGIIIFPWPYKIIPLFFLTGLVYRIIEQSVENKWIKKIPGKAFLFSSIILGVQAVFLELFYVITAGARELPFWLGKMIEVIAGLFRLNAGITEQGLSLFTMRATHVLGATWELILDPVLLAFFTGSLVFFTLCFIINVHSSVYTRGYLLEILKKLGLFTLTIILWIPIRYVMLLSLFIHRALLTGYDDPLNLMNQFWNQWIFISLLVIPFIIIIWLFRMPDFAADSENRSRENSFRLLRKESIIICLLTAFTFFILFMGLFWDPAGTRKNGKVLVDEYHSEWERTDRPFDTKWYGNDSTYNYACMYDYSTHYYDISRLEEKISGQVLKDCDVLILKMPTKQYDNDEIISIMEYVKQGGGVFLVGEHTDVFRTSSYLNTVARQFGFEFVSDILLDIDNKFRQIYNSPFIPHPIVQHIPSFRFQVSCSIHPRNCTGRTVIRSPGLKRLYADYHIRNYYPVVEDYSNMRYGSFVQLWAQRYGKGRVAAFTDSTIFSNFSAFEPGISELWLCIIEWLNHRNSAGEPRFLLIFLSIILTGITVFFIVKYNYREWILLFCIPLFVLSLTGLLLTGIHGISMPFPQKTSPYIDVTIDRTVCDSTLTQGGFIELKDDGFGIFEMWILRLGYFTRRCRDDSVFTGNLAVFFYPERDIPGDFLNKLIRYVEGGGHVLVIDSTRNTHSTANKLLEPFQLRLENPGDLKGYIDAPSGFPLLPLPSSLAVQGGSPFISVNEKPVGAYREFGSGTITVIGFGSLFNDDNMGNYFDVIPTEELLKKYTIEYDIIRSIIERTMDTLIQ